MRHVPDAPDQYFLETQRLGLRHWSDADLPLAMSLWGDPLATRLIGGPFSAEQVAERLAREIATARAHGVQYWPMFLLATGEHVGCGGLRPYPPEAKALEIGVHLKPPYWGAGYAAEASRAIMAHAFTTLGAASLFAGHHPGNAASRRVLTALGFRYTHDEYYPPTGLQHPSYRITADEFLKGRSASET
jgi:RimJ/RimL family protein N-acetyltransferase